jgi:hypothetical protein
VPVCVYWDEDDLDWKKDGCVVDTSHSNTNMTTCQCDHLTNFGLIFGGSSVNDPGNPTKSAVSNIVGGISIACLIFTQFVLHFGM